MHELAFILRNKQGRKILSKGYKTAYKAKLRVGTTPNYKSKQKTATCKRLHTRSFKKKKGKPSARGFRHFTPDFGLQHSRPGTTKHCLTFEFTSTDTLNPNSRYPSLVDNCLVEVVDGITLLPFRVKKEFASRRSFLKS